MSAAQEHLKAAALLYKQLRQLEKAGRVKSAEYKRLENEIKIEATSFLAALESGSSLRAPMFGPRKEK